MPTTWVGKRKFINSKNVNTSPSVPDKECWVGGG